MQDCGHATPSENRSPAGKAQNCAASRLQVLQSGPFGRIGAWIPPVPGSGALARFDEDSANWFQVAAAKTLGVNRSRSHVSALFELRGATGNLYNPRMELSERQRKYLRGLGHVLNPVLLIGQHGVTPAVIAEASRALHDHELIKVKFRGAERAARDAGLTQLATATESILLQRIGHTALYYKRRIDHPGIVIPDA
jgi:RNA-binding protein